MTTKHRRKVVREARLIAGLASRVTESVDRLLAAGRVLGERHQEKVQAAVMALRLSAAALDPAVIAEQAGAKCETCGGEGKIKEGSTDCPDCGGTGKVSQESHAARVVANAEAYSGAADDAGDAAMVISCLLDLMGDERDEPEQLAILQSALTLLVTFMQMEVAEIGTPDDDEPEPTTDYWGWEAVRKRLEDSGGPISMRSVSERGGLSRLVESGVPITESALGPDGEGKVKIIAPGWGSSGYYAAEVLRRDGPKVFPEGTKMFWDHPTITEEFERPERSLRDLAGTLTAAAAWDEIGYMDKESGQMTGPGLYAPIKAYDDYVPTLNEIAKDIGVSIRAYGKATMGEAEGKTGQLITELVDAESIDFVTTPGAGGQVLSLFEAARQRPEPPAPKEAPLMEVEKDPKFVEERTARLRAEEALVLIEAGKVVATKLAEAKIPALTRTRLAAALSESPPAKDGKLDKPVLEKRIEDAIAAEEEYLHGLAETGAIKGMGDTSHEPDDAAADAKLESGFKRLGLGESAAKVAATGRS